MSSGPAIDDSLIFLQTQRLVLRRFSADTASIHVRQLFALDNDPEVMRYINGGIATPLSIIETQILPTFLHYNPQLPQQGFFAAYERPSSVFVGWFVFRAKADDPQLVEIGYRFCRNAWGKGYATEGGRALIDKGFGESDIQRVIATTYQDNYASRRVMEKLGLSFRRSFRLAPEDVAAADTSHSDSVEVWDGDDVEYSLERGDWVRHR